MAVQMQVSSRNKVLCESGIAALRPAARSGSERTGAHPGSQRVAARVPRRVSCVLGDGPEGKYSFLVRWTCVFQCVIR